MSANHTPGPWTVWTSNSFRRIGNDDLMLHVVEPTKQPDGHPDLHFRNGGYDGPDARLICAAPDLLEAAQALVDRWDTPLWKDAPHTGEFIHRLRRAIAKATGADK